MLPVKLLLSHGAVILRARNSELLILQQHVLALQSLTEPREFSNYFLRSALVNRPARKLFEAWLRKDQGLWQRLYDMIQESKTSEDGPNAAEHAAPAVAEKATAPAAAKKEEKKAKAEPTAEAAPAKKKVAKKAASAEGEAKATKKKTTVAKKATSSKKATSEAPAAKKKSTSTKKATTSKATSKKKA